MKAGLGDCSGSGLGVVLMELEYGSSVSECVCTAVDGHDARLGGESVEDCALLDVMAHQLLALAGRACFLPCHAGVLFGREATI